MPFWAWAAGSFGGRTMKKFDPQKMVATRRRQRELKPLTRAGKQLAVSTLVLVLSIACMGIVAYAAWWGYTTSNDLSLPINLWAHIWAYTGLTVSAGLIIPLIWVTFRLVTPIWWADAKRASLALWRWTFGRGFSVSCQVELGDREP